MVGLVDFLHAAGVMVDTGIKQTKIHLATKNNDADTDPLDFYYAGKFKAWQEYQTRKNFKCRHIISLIKFKKDQWLFVGVHESLGCKPRNDNPDCYEYSTKLLPDQDDFIGRIIVHHKRSGRQAYPWYTADAELPILEIRREKVSIGDFPGFNAVNISHEHLKIITHEKIPSWHGALANIKGVYLITNTDEDKKADPRRHYVGKASGDVGIWQRWCSYAKNGHGGNKELRVLIDKYGSAYAKHFQYSILEIADTHASDKDILARESHWMNVMQTRKFGLNYTSKPDKV